MKVRPAAGEARPELRVLVEPLYWGKPNPVVPGRPQVAALVQQAEGIRGLGKPMLKLSLGDCQRTTSPYGYITSRPVFDTELVLASKGHMLKGQTLQVPCARSSDPDQGGGGDYARA